MEATSMTKQRIILANDSRLVREMLNRILHKTDNLEVVKEITDHADLPIAIKNPEAEWVIISMPVDKKMPDWVDTYIIDHPRMRFMAVANDGSWVKTKWLEHHEEEMDNLSLRDLIHILGGIMETDRPFE
jgi:DNA-binding NarL/FixJ family response regulator